MRENNNSSATTMLLQQDARRKRYVQIGRDAGTDTNADPTTLVAAYDNLYKVFLDDHRADKNAIEQAMARIEADILVENQNIAKLQGSLAFKKAEKADINQVITNLETKRQKTEEEGKANLDKLTSERSTINESQPDGSWTFDFCLFGVGAIGTFLFLVLFYLFTATSAYIGVSKNFRGVFDPEAYSKFLQGSIAYQGLIFFTTFLLMYLGIAFHRQIEKKKYFVAIVPAMFSLGLDVMLGYLLSQAIHTVNNIGKKSIEIDYGIGDMITDINFYIPIFFGFGGYILWGWLMGEFKREYENIQPDRIKALQLEEMDAKIEREKERIANELAKIDAAIETQKNLLLRKEGEITDTEASIQQSENAIMQLNRDYNAYEAGTIPVSSGNLRDLVGLFMTGWNAAIQFKFGFEAEKAQKLTELADEQRESWLQLKIQSFK